MPTPEWVDKVKGKKLLDVHHDTTGIDYGMQLEFEDGIILDIWLGSRYCEDAWLKVRLGVKHADTKSG